MNNALIFKITRDNLTYRAFINDNVHTKFGDVLMRRVVRWPLISLIMVVLLTAASSLNAETLRVATFNVSLEANRLQPKNTPLVLGSVLEAIKQGHPLVRNVSDIIRYNNPDVILLNEIDADRDTLAAFVAQLGVDFPYTFIPEVNTGVLSQVDVNHDGQLSLPSDGYGFGHYPGHYGMALLSKYPIQHADVRCLNTFLWKDMPGAMLPIASDGSAWYSTQDLTSLRLSSKTHCDVPVLVNNVDISVIISHPTPPVFDGPEDRNGKRNHDEVRLIKDYLEQADYLASYVAGRDFSQRRFVILGDLNASVDSDATVPGTMQQLLNHPLINANSLPISEGAAQHTPQNPKAAAHTAAWRSRADYVLPSHFGFRVRHSEVFWPAKNAPLAHLMSREGSDHRLVLMDLDITAKQ